MASFNSTLDRYREVLGEQHAGALVLPNQNLDVGTVTPPGKYKLTDATYSKLLHELQGHYTEMPQELRSNILAFYRDLDRPNTTKADAGDWARVLKELDEMQSADRDVGPRPN